VTPPRTGDLGGVPPDSDNQAASRRRRRRATWPVVSGFNVYLTIAKHGGGPQA